MHKRIHGPKGGRPNDKFELTAFYVGGMLAEVWFCETEEGVEVFEAEMEARSDIFATAVKRLK